mmetsp:Transcript_39646/g.89912  ORF Transcript_39646/g.89912 Transcript_39646/m.89912 type:complete len:107 (-) Transcript_39646:149-469(-)
MINAEQRQYFASVKEATLGAAKAMTAAHAQGNREVMIHRLEELSRIYNEQKERGHSGLVALTEYCNALVHSDAVEVVNVLQGDTDAHVAKLATGLFEGVVPRIWSS